MVLFSFTKMFFLLSITYTSLTLILNAESSKPYDLVNDVCTGLDNVNFCLNVLKSDDRSKFAKNISILTTIVVDLATTNATKTHDYFLGVKTGPPGVMESLKDCISAYDNVILNFKICLKEEDCDLIGYDIHVAGDEVRRCQATADANGAHGSFITTYNNVTQDFCGLGESLANRMCSN